MSANEPFLFTSIFPNVFCLQSVQFIFMTGSGIGSVQSEWVLQNKIDMVP